MTQAMDQILNEKQELIWKDRKRYFGLPLSFTRYSIRGVRFYISKGLLRIEENELLLYRIMDIKLNRTITDRIFGVGTITLYTVDKTDSVIKVIRIKKPAQVRDLISRMVEEERTKVRVRGKEIFGVGDDNSDDDNSTGVY
ncbi:MAG: PH domain-containing protein [Saccharofermentanales bacterium]